MKNNRLQQLKQQSVRDLAWVLASSPLIEHTQLWNAKFFSQEFDAAKAWLNKLDKAPEELETYLKSSKRKNLGSYFESLVSFWLEHRPNTNIIAQNLQVVGPERTIGEFDFILDIDDQILHLEVAVKFYLAKKNSANWDCWVGTNKQDRLDIKLNKMINMQMQLANTPEGSKTLQEVGINSADLSSVGLFKGYFFNHFAQSNMLWPDNQYEEANKAVWCNLDDIESCTQDMVKEFYIMNKPYWLSSTPKKSAMGFEQFKLEVEKLIAHGRSALCSSKDADGVETRFFVVKNGW